MFNLVVVCLILGCGFLLVLLLCLYAFKHLRRGWSFKDLFKDFNRKIWMTLCLGCLFLSFYFLFVVASSFFIQQGKTALFFMMYQNPVPFIYGGLWIFAFLSLSIYLARMIIKYFYLTRGKDS